MPFDVLSVFLAAAVGSATGIVSNVVLRKFTNSNDEDKLAVDKAKGLVEIICDEGMNYWEKASSEFDDIIKVETVIKRRLSKLSNCINEVRHLDKCIANEFFKFKSSVTGGNFESKDRAADPDRANNEILAAEEALLSALTNSYRAKYRKVKILSWIRNHWWKISLVLILIFFINSVRVF